MPSAEASALAPFRHRLFLWLWTGNAVSALGTWIQSTASAWVMTDLAPDPLMVSLIQAAAQLPVLLLALPAGALADVVDRRRYLVWTNLGMLVSAGLLAASYAAGLVTPWTLLALTALLAAFSALNNPAWASSVPLTVPRQDLPQALVLNSIGFNVARAIGPAVGGLIVASAGAAAAFAANAASFALVALLVATVLALPRMQGLPGVPPEPPVQAMRLGLRYAGAEPAVRVALVRSAAFYAFASAIWALLPLYVRDVLGLASTSYGLMLGCIGAGAVLGGLLVPRLRSLLSRDGFVMVAGLLTGGALVPVALLPHPAVVAASMLVFGVGWIIGSSNLQTTVQLACAPWVRARGLAIYQAIYNGGMGLGAIGWGWLGMHAGLTGTILAAGLGGMVMAVVARLQALPGEIDDPSEPAARPLPKLDVRQEVLAELASSRHPVLVTIAYVVDAADVPGFRAAMRDLSAARRRDGAVAWMLTRDIERLDHWIEAFRLPDWHELRRGAARINLTDDAASARASAFHRGAAPPELRVLVADPP
ncbi:MFS transporter [Falsiroseomonas oryziterrae]|uniref:MFS transporter n=1 Tax=Falsiroseomonas oryziterrae TaxID=2911368 RepID=UPI001F3837A6|nr:MFS transporter [Roseomonas sp. NPKOSM-4]